MKARKGFPMSFVAAIIKPGYSASSVGGKKVGRNKINKNTMCVFLAYLLSIGCLQWVACVCKDHPGGYRDVLFPPF